MKKYLLMALVAVMSLNASAQFKQHADNVQPGKQEVTQWNATQKSYHAVAPVQNQKMKSYGPMGKHLTLDASRLQPVERHLGTKSETLKQTKALTAKQSQLLNHLQNAKPTMTVKAGAPRKAPAFKETYTGKGTDYTTKTDTTWTMTPTTATKTIDGEEKEINVLVDVIPLASYLKTALAKLYPNGVPIEYTMGDDGTITIEPQSIASYQNDAKDTTFYISIFSVNDDAEEGIITMNLAEDGLLKITDGNGIAFGEFANVPYGDLSSEIYQGYDLLYANVRYVYDGQKDGLTLEQDYKGHGVDLRTNQATGWTMQRGTFTENGVDAPIFLNMSPFDSMFASIYPDGIYVEYEQNDNTITVKPQVLASITDDEGKPEYLLICSGTAEDGVIVLTTDAEGNLTTIEDESIIIAGWSTSKFDPSFETYNGWYSYTDRVTYRLPNAAPVAPADVCFEPNELVLYAGLGISGYSYNDNLAVMGAYAPVSFRNGTFDEATSFEWSVKETDVDDNETVITGNDNNVFTFNTKGDATYSDFKLIASNEGAQSQPFTLGAGHALNSSNAIQYEAAHFYGGGGQGSFQFSDDTYATMTRQNPDGDLAFYTNWGTPDIYEDVSISRIYSYQGKPATPLYITGVTLPMVDFKANEDFNLHINLYKCTRSANGRLTLGDIIAQGDATIDNVVSDYAESSGLSAVNFNELYAEDEFGMSETLDYLFIEDEFVIVIEGWDNGTFSGVLGAQDITGNEITSTWFDRTGRDGEMRSYTTWKTALFIGLLDATYGYLYTNDNTNLQFAAEGGEATIHVNPMYYGIDDETEQPTYSLSIESITIDGEEAEELPEGINIEIANEDYTTATGTNANGETYEYFVNGIDYDMVVTTDALPEGVDSRKVEIVFMQTGARLKVVINQGQGAGIIGDVNADGFVDVADISTILTIMADETKFDKAADVNNDGQIDVADISTTLTIMAGK